MNDFSSISLFWVAVLAFIAIALAFVIPPLMRRKPDHPSADRGAVNVAIYQDQLRELEAEFNAGELSLDEYETARREIEKRVAEEVPSPAPASPGRSGRWAGFAMAGLIPVAAVALYLVLGSPGDLTSARAVFPQAQAAGQQNAQQSAQQGAQHDAAAMVNALENRLKQKPDDVQGWAMLARSYAAMGRFGEAFKAYDKAVGLKPDDSHLLADYAEAVALSQGRTMQGKPLDLVVRALKLNDKDEKALMLAGVAAGQAQDFDQAVMYWRRLLKILPPGSDFAKEVSVAIGKAEERAAAAKKTGDTKVKMQKVEGQAVSGILSIKQSLASKLRPSDAVFVFAQAPGGSPMPLAVLKISGNQLPYRFTLDDSLAMSPQNKLTQHPEVMLVARVSKSGQPMPQSGDLQGKVGPVKLGKKDIQLAIDSVLP